MKNIVLSIATVVFNLLMWNSTVHAQIVTISGDVSPCAGSTITYTATVPQPPQGYTFDGISWYLENSSLGFSSLTSYPIYFQPLLVGGVTRTIKAAARYSRTISGNTSYTYYEGTLDISVRQLTDAVPSISPDYLSIECGQTPIQTFSVNVTQITSNIAYTWNLPSGWTALSATNGASLTVQAPPYSGGTITLTVTDTKCNTSVTRNANIYRTVPPLGSISGGAGCFCAGQTQSFSVPAVSGATSYQWAASGSLFIAGGQGTSSVSVGTSGSGGNLTCYAVTACGNTNTSTSNFIPTASAPPPAPIVTVMSNPCANYQRPGTLRVTNVADICTNYIWSGDAGVMISSGLDLASVEVPGFGYGVSVYGVNPCGTSAATSRSIPVDPNCPGPLRVAPLGIIAAPNPFSDRTTLSYTLSEVAEVALEVTTPVGKRILTLVNDRQKAGDHDVTFDGSRLPTGVYVATLTVTTRGGERQTASVQLTLTR